MEELKPCPFCRSPAKLVDHSEEREFFRKTNASGRKFIKTVFKYNRKVHIYYVSVFSVGCSKKNCIGRNNARIFKTKNAAIEAWNRRVEDERS